MGIGIPSVNIPSPSDFYNDTKDRDNDLADSGRRPVDRGRDFVTDQIDNGNFVFDRIKEEARGIANAADALTTITSDDIHNLEPGDSVSLDAEVEGGGGLDLHTSTLEMVPGIYANIGVSKRW